MTPHPVLDRPWQKVAMDLFDLEDKDYLIIADYFSKYFEVSQLSSTTSPATISRIKPIFARFGIPDEVMSDNGPQFDTKSSRTLQEYMVSNTPPRLQNTPSQMD